MPRRSERDAYADAFEGNPFEGFEADAMFTELRWGDAPADEWAIDAPEALAGLGELAMLDLDTHDAVWSFDEQNGPFVAVGVDSNCVYLLPRLRDGGPVRRFPPFDPGRWEKLGRVRQTDYYSIKQGEAAYYYHEHERPFPIAWREPTSGVIVFVPAGHKGRRSYAVAKEGIVG
jgi:hypothetical protein